MPAGWPAADSGGEIGREKNDNDRLEDDRSCVDEALATWPAVASAKDAAAPQPPATAASTANDAAQPEVTPTGDTVARNPAQAKEKSDIVIVGSRIAGARVTEALPVVVVNRDKLDTIGAVSGDELIRSIPQMGDVSFNPGNNPQTSNAARGDVGSVDLRSLGVGNTLVLLNGRRVIAPTGKPGPVGYGHRAGPQLQFERHPHRRPAAPRSAARRSGGASPVRTRSRAS